MIIIPTYCCGDYRNGRCPTCPVARARDEAIARVIGHTEAMWKIEAFRSADRVMLQMDIFNTDDIWKDLIQRGIPLPHEHRAMVGVTGVLNKTGAIEWTGEYTPSVLPWAHGRPNRIYKVIT